MIAFYSVRTLFSYTDVSGLHAGRLAVLRQGRLEDESQKVDVLKFFVFVVIVTSKFKFLSPRHLILRRTTAAGAACCAEEPLGVGGCPEV